MMKEKTTSPIPLISVCVCTYKRPRQLEILLECLDRQVTGGLFSFSVIVVDNDASQSGRAVVELCAKRLRIPIAYGVEPEQNIALARNASVAMSNGEFVAFIDDDEEPSNDWLRRLYETLREYRVDGVLGPVLPKFERDAPQWAVKGAVFRRPMFASGQVIHWTTTGAGNVLVKRQVLLELHGPFRPEFGAGGEDRDLFRRAMTRGRKFVWAADAICFEPVSPERTRVTFQIRRALLRGKMAWKASGGARSGILKSVIAVPIYVAVLPFALIRGSHVGVTLMVKTFDHLGKLLAACGIDLVGDKYIS